MKLFGLTLSTAPPRIGSNPLQTLCREHAVRKIEQPRELDHSYIAKMMTVGMIRLQKEIKMLAEEPPPGVCAWPVEDALTHLQAQIQGPQDTPYERGTFLLDLQIPDRYPFEPPKVRFVTPIYHPNIDTGGRICLDTLKMRPAGSWTPSMNVPTLLTTIRLLMAHPNGDDGLMPDITDLFLKNPSKFADVARAHVEKHARQEDVNHSERGGSSEAKSVSANLLPAVATPSGVKDEGQEVPRTALDVALATARKDRVDAGASSTSAARSPRREGVSCGERSAKPQGEKGRTSGDVIGGKAADREPPVLTTTRPSDQRSAQSGREIGSKSTTDVEAKDGILEKESSEEDNDGEGAPGGPDAGRDANEDGNSSGDGAWSDSEDGDESDDDTIAKRPRTT